MMRGFLTIVCWLAWAATAVANPFPALYSVTGVAPDDVLNIRILPDAGSEVIGSFAPDARDIEVLAIEASGKWAMVSLSEQTGWIALRFVNPQPVNEDYALTPNLQCSGAEPFWSLDIRQGHSATLRSLTDETITMPTGLVRRAAGRSDRYSLQAGGQLVATIRRRICSDGMSDRAYGLDVDVVMTGDDPQHLVGCCSLLPD